MPPMPGNPGGRGRSAAGPGLPVVRRRSYPIVGGVPRLAGESYAASFGRQWNRYDVARPEEDEATFRVKTGVDPGDLAGRLVLDAGCGGGRYARLLGRHGARVVGVDLSAAVEKAAELCAELPDVAIVQADLLDLPVAEGGVRPGVLDRGPAPHPRPAPGVRADRPAGQAGGTTRRLALPPKHAAPGVAQFRASAPSRRGCRPRCSSRSAPAWACSAASPCSTAPSTSWPISRAIPTGPSASATTSTGTPRATSRTTPPRSCGDGSSRRASPTSPTSRRPGTAGSTMGLSPQPHHRQRGQCHRTPAVIACLVDWPDAAFRIQHSQIHKSNCMQ